MATRLIFFGNERLGTGLTTTAPTLQALLAAGYEIAAVVIAQSTNKKSRKSRQVEIVQVAEANRIPVLVPGNLDDAKDQLAAYEADAAVLVAYGKLVPEAIIGLFEYGIINIHPSLLPAHRGPTPLESVILKGESMSGVSLMQLATKMDAGPVFDQEEVQLQGDETKQQLADQLLNLGKDMLIEQLPHILDGSLPPAEQDEEQASYDQRIEKSAGQLDFKQSAHELERQVRAYAGWPRSRTLLGTTEIIITESHAEDITGVPGTLWLDGKQLGFYCASGVLAIDKLIPAGKKEMPAEAFLAGYKPE